MARFYGKIGYGLAVETTPGVWEDVVVVRDYYGDVLLTARNLQPGEQLHDDIVVGNRISIVADAYAYEHFFDIKYVEWSGVKWKVDKVEVDRPRMTLSLGGVYNGP